MPARRRSRRLTASTRRTLTEGTTPAGEIRPGGRGTIGPLPGRVSNRAPKEGDVSVKAMAAVWDMDLPRDQKFILLAYADHADHEGRNIFPAVASVAQKTGYSERSVQTITRELERVGRLVADGKGPGGTRRWKLVLDLGGEVLAPGGVQPAAPGGAVAVAPEPSVTIPPSLRKERERTPDPLFDAIATVSQVDPATAGATIGKVKSVLAKAGYTPEEVLAFKRWWWQGGFRKRPPTVWQVQEQIGIVRTVPAISEAPAPVELWRD